MKARPIGLILPLLGISSVVWTLGCGFEQVKKIRYSPPSGEMRLKGVPDAPMAEVKIFVDNRKGQIKASGAFLMWLVPYTSYEFPRFYEKSGEGHICLGRQYRGMVRHHLFSKGLFRFREDDDEPVPPEYEPLFKVTGKIWETTCWGRRSLFGLGIVPGLIPLMGLVSYAEKRFTVNMTLSCTDIAGNKIATHRVSGETDKWKGLVIAEGVKPYEQLDLLAAFFPEHVEQFAEKVRDALEQRDQAYWDILFEQRQSRIAGKLVVKTRIAVMDLKAVNVDPDIVDTATDVIRRTFAEVSGIDVLTRDDMLTVLNVQKLDTGCDSLECWEPIGRELRVERLVAGSVEGLESGEYVVELRLIAIDPVGTSKMIGKQTARSQGKLGVHQAASRAARRLLKE